MTKLPDKLYQLLDLALKDLRACELDNRYKINMGTYHTKPFGYPCHVCLAGAVMAKSLGTNIDATVGPSSFDKDTCKKLNALDVLRTGDVSTALHYMGKIYFIRKSLSRKVTFYEKDKQEFFKDMEQLRDDLKKAKL